MAKKGSSSKKSSSGKKKSLSKAQRANISKMKKEKTGIYAKTKVPTGLRKIVGSDMALNSDITKKFWAYMADLKVSENPSVYKLDAEAKKILGQKTKMTGREVFQGFAKYRKKHKSK